MRRPHTSPRRSAAFLRRKIPPPQVSQFANPERKTLATPLTPLTAQSAPQLQDNLNQSRTWGVSLARSLHCNYFLLAVNLASYFAEEQMAANQRVFITAKKKTAVSLR